MPVDVALLRFSLSGLEAGAVVGGFGNVFAFAFPQGVSPSGSSLHVVHDSGLVIF